MHQPRRRAARLALVPAGAAVSVLLLAGAASAHVTVTSSDATRGGYAKVTFRVPNETDNASTTKIRVFFPAAHPLASVSVQPHPGWTFRVRTHELAHPISSDDGSVTRVVSEIDWTADSAASAIRPGEFDEFNVSAGPLPTSPTMVFKALQTYSDGQIVRWIDPTPAGGPEPEHPAPVLTLAPAGDSTPGSAGTSAPMPMVSATPDDGRANAALVVSIVALVVAVAAGAAALLRRSRS
jgi:uncharacterized protein YcnI